MNYKDFSLGDWIGHISGAIEDERELDGNEMRDLVEFLSKIPRWIPVSERLPEDGRPVLIYAWNVHHVIARYDEFRTDDGYKKAWVTADAWNGNTEIKHEVIAWMPLQEPTRKERTNENTT